MSLGTGNQKYCDKTEIQVAQNYLKLLEQANVKVNFFVSGKAFIEEWSDLQPICHHSLVEIGGHNYNCLEPSWWHRLWNKLIGSYNGPAWYQRYDAKKTIQIIEKYTGQQVLSWRNHMYMHGPLTESILAECGIKVCSDGVQAHSNGLQPHPSGLYNFPINIIPDHEHLYHAERTPEWVERWVRRYNWSDDFGSKSYYIAEWTELVLTALKEHEERGIISNLIIHPITMYLCDQFENFKRILAYISTCETVHISELYQTAKNA